MAGFLFGLKTADGSPASPSTLESAVPNWRAGDVISLGRRQLRVVDKRDDDADQPPVHRRGRGRMRRSSLSLIFLGVAKKAGHATRRKLAFLQCRCCRGHA
jgi:hypothetical protein